MPSLWVIRWLDQSPMPWIADARAIGFVMAFVPVTTQVTGSLVQEGFRYWQIVGLREETTKLLHVLLALVNAPHLVRNTRDGLLLGAHNHILWGAATKGAIAYLMAAP